VYFAADVEKRVLGHNDGRKLAMRYNVPFFETSALNGKNVREAFDKLIFEMTVQQKFTAIPLKDEPPPPSPLPPPLLGENTTEKNDKNAEK
jgi:hypothetical protein